MQEIYFDNAATTQVLPEIADIAVRMMCEDYGNPSAMYGRGLQAERAVKAGSADMTDEERIFFYKNLSSIADQLEEYYCRLINGV